MQNPSKKALWVAIGLPAAFLLFTIIAALAPIRFVRPAYNIIYTLDEGYPYEYRYENDNGRIVKRANPYPAVKGEANPDVVPYEPKLFIYDVKTEKSSPVTFDEAKNIKISPDVKSPDGYTLSYDGSGGDAFSFLFGGARYDGDGFYISGKFASKKIMLSRTSPYPGYARAQFLGWVVK